MGSAKPRSGCCKCFDKMNRPTSSGGEANKKLFYTTIDRSKSSQQIAIK